jgi:hypothetical protein
MKRILLLLPAVLLSCSQESPKAQAPAPQSQAQPESGLGEQMSLTQMRHAKLGLAGMNENWELAAYELNELKEGFDDIVASHPTDKNAPIPPKTLLPAVMKPPLDQLQSAISSRNGMQFIAAYDLLTRSCNGCHQAEQHGYIVIKAPEPNAYSNQEFRPQPKP